MKQLKVSFIGDANVGKTSIVTKYIRDTFGEQTLPTVGVANFDTKVEIKGKAINLNIWDTAGQERFRSLVPIYIKGANLIVLVFDVSDISTFKSLPNWIDVINDTKDDKCPVLIVANKMDLKQEVTVEDVKKWGRDNNYSILFASAKTGLNITELFQDIGIMAYNSVISKNVVPKKSKDSNCC